MSTLPDNLNPVYLLGRAAEWVKHAEDESDTEESNNRTRIAQVYATMAVAAATRLVGSD